MEIVQLNLKNFRTHKKLEVSFDAGITGIVGNNGAGKSSIVEAISFLLTGEGYGAKADMLSVGETSGYVLGHLRINDKEAILERHLDSSKVAFKYDGVTYKKAGEVSAIWEQLFQIDKNIFKNIVIAKQGETALLFSGDNATKEKIFQKIFLVPNTTKLRDTLWNKYIKPAPPEYPTIDEEQYLKDIINLESQLDSKKGQLNSHSRPLDSEHVSLSTRLNYLESCKNSSVYKDSILSDIAGLKQQQETIYADLNSIKAKLDSIDYNLINSALQQLVINKPKYEQKSKIAADLEHAHLELAALENIDLDGLQQLEATKAQLQAEYNVVNDEHSQLISKIQDFKTKGLIDVDACPYCGSELKDVATYIAHLEDKLPKLLDQLKNKQTSLLEVVKTFDELTQHKARHDKAQQTVTQLAGSLDALKDVYFDMGEYTLYTSVIQQYNDLAGRREELNIAVQGIASKLIDCNVKLITVPIYDNAKTSIEEEMAQVISELAQVKLDIAIKKDLELTIARDEQTLKLTQKTFDDNAKVKLKNQKRNQYIYVLNELYELFHTSQFPRKLIQTYAGTVSEYLNENLQLFNFPYTAQVNDNFGIDVFESSGLKLPSVSGGQEVMLGVALRLALHNMFGSAFPMMILDEGSVHLSNESKKSYFEIIRSLKKVSNLKQIIIVDHDEDLASVVDNTIKL